MAKKGKKSKKQEPAAPQLALTEWQKRNLEFQQKKREREVAQAQLQEAEREAKRAVYLGGEQASDVAGEPEAAKQAVKRRPKPIKVQTERGLAWQKALPLFLFSAIVFVLSAVMVSPLSKSKLYAIQGATNTADQDLIAASGIKSSDYISQVLLGLKGHEKAIVANDPWVKSAKIGYEFPNRFLIQVEENQVIAYRQTATGYDPVLENGKLVEEVNSSQLPESFLTIELDEAKDIENLVGQLMQVDESIRQDIQSIRPIKAATKDLLQLMMADGHQIRVPLSQVAEKLPYYQTIRTKLLEPSIIDMEVGIYATTETLEALAAETKASYEAAEKERLEQEAREAERAKRTSKPSSSGDQSASSTSSGRSDLSEASSDDASSTQPEASSEVATETSDEVASEPASSSHN